MLSHSCIVPLGGASTSGVRFQSTARYIYWMCSTPPIVAMMGRLAGATRVTVLKGAAADVVMVLAGLLAAEMDSSLAGWCVALAVSFLGNGYVMHLFVGSLQDAFQRASDTSTQVRCGWRCEGGRAL